MSELEMQVVRNRVSSANKLIEKYSANDTRVKDFVKYGVFGILDYLSKRGFDITPIEPYVAPLRPLAA